MSTPFGVADAFDLSTDSGTAVEYRGSITSEHGRGILLGVCGCSDCNWRSSNDPNRRAAVSTVNGHVLKHVHWTSLTFPRD